MRAAARSWRQNSSALLEGVEWDAVGDGTREIGLGDDSKAIGELFEIDGGSPELENPGDTNADGVYDIDVEVSDSGGLTNTMVMTITIADAGEAPTVSTKQADQYIDVKTTICVDGDGGTVISKLINGSSVDVS